MSAAPESSKRAASGSPVPTPDRNAKRLRLGADLWSDRDHVAQDNEVRRRMGDIEDYDPHNRGDMAFFLGTIIQVAAENSRSDAFGPPATDREYRKELTEDPDLMELAGDAYTSGSYKHVRCLERFRKTASTSRQNAGENHLAADTASSHSATEKAWNEAYVGSAADRLYDTIKQHCATPDTTLYARYAAILQSSGMGKSRMIDELSKKHLVIPINLRPPEDTGFPAADTAVREFFDARMTDKDHILRRSNAFLIALFNTAKSYLQAIDQHVAQLVHGLPPDEYPQSTVQKFRLLMTAGQTFTQQGANRREFYSSVVNHAQELLQVATPPEPTDGSTTVSTVAPSVASTTQPRQHLSLATVVSPSGQVSFTQNGQMHSIQRAALELVQCVGPDLDLAKLKRFPPLVILAFDEAHVIATKQRFDTESFSNFSELRRALRSIIELPFFSLFLSTTGRIQDFTPHRQFDNSGRIQSSDLFLLGPFTELGFDQMMKGSKVSDGMVSIEEVSTVKYMAQFGRPLFGSRYIHGNEEIQRYIVLYAAEKLLGGVPLPRTTEGKKLTLKADAKLACMAVRLALEFNATTLASQDRERRQVERHMRVCLVMSPEFETAVTVAASEPLLAEAAHLLMKDREAFDLPRALLDELKGPGLDKGFHGELICMVLLLMARDLLAQEKDGGGEKSLSFEVPHFMESLLALKWAPVILGSKPARCCTKSGRNVPFHEAFAKSKMHFNHFIKVHDFKVIKRDYLWRLIARGAAVLCADYQGGVDVILPFVYSDDRNLGRDNVSAIFIQVKNDRRFSKTPNVFLFDAINPYFLGFFPLNEKNPSPIIRMVFALAAKEACVEVIKNASTRKNPARAAKSTTQKKNQARQCPDYTAYDIWCAKTSADTFGVVRPEDESIYAELLKVSRTFPDAYEMETKIDSIKSARRGMNPGTAENPDHWAQFTTAGNESQEDEGVVNGDIDFD